MANKMDSLNEWLNVAAGHTIPITDDERFYKAIYEILLINKGIYINAEEVGTYIEESYKGKVTPEILIEEAQRATIRFEVIQEFCLINKII